MFLNTVLCAYSLHQFDCLLFSVLCFRKLFLEFEDISQCEQLQRKSICALLIISEMLFRVQNYINKELGSKISRHWVENSFFCKPVLASILAWKIKVDTILSSVILRKSFLPIYIAISTAKFKFTQLLSVYPCSNIHLC